ncbi:alpha/beta fold hydrolase [Allobranchiibius sp. GilTou38]|uniref:alpha/beta fold hydrolase n=1 Tax=Allobranchiibius sp. GilTou38 TaxID=2815210 RepID=UPI001AA0EC66|nr:hypothetical protein [Allobranchiibius sp. GilTou38]
MTQRAQPPLDSELNSEIDADLEIDPGAPADSQVAAAHRAGTAVRGVTGAIRDTHGAVASKVFASARRTVGPVVTPVEFAHDHIARAAYGASAVALEGMAEAVGATAAKAAQAGRTSKFGRGTTRRASGVLAFVHGFNGDKMASSGRMPLSSPMSLRRSGERVPATADGLARAYPDATPQIVIFVHGFVGTEQMWKRHAHRDDDGRRLSYGRRLEAHGDWSALWVRYNTGLRIKSNGLELALLIEQVVDHWPVPVERVVLVGHSMGGLVASSALLQWPTSSTWGPLVSDLITLGTPYHGSPIEQGANYLAEFFSGYGATRWLGDVIQFRSEGIKDLRPGNLFLADTRGAMPDAAEWRQALAPQMVVRHLAVAGVLTKDPHARLGGIIGDGIVPRASARAGADNDLSRSTMMGSMSHNDLVNDPRVYEVIADVLGVQA